MDAKEKAKELFKKFYVHAYTDEDGDAGKAAKQCAIIVVDEILNDKYKCGCEQSIVMDGHYQTYHTYWIEVKRNIEAL